MKKIVPLITLSALLGFTSPQYAQRLPTWHEKPEKTIEYESRVVDFNDRHNLLLVKLVGNQMGSVSFYHHRDPDWKNSVVFSGTRSYNICTFDTGKKRIKLITKVPTGVVENGNYSVTYFGLRKDMKLNAIRFIKEYIGISNDTMDNYYFDENIEGVIESIKLEVKNE